MAYIIIPFVVFEFLHDYWNVSYTNFITFLNIHNANKNHGRRVFYDEIQDHTI